MKRGHIVELVLADMSPPMRGRGLKPVKILAEGAVYGRPPCGGVD